MCDEVTTGPIQNTAESEVGFSGIFRPYTTPN